MKKLNEDLAKSQDGVKVFNDKLAQVNEKLEKERLDGLTAAQVRRLISLYVCIVTAIELFVAVCNCCRRSC